MSFLTRITSSARIILLPTIDPSRRIFRALEIIRVKELTQNAILSIKYLSSHDR